MHRIEAAADGAPLRLSAVRSRALAGRQRPPGDKSISHRALLLGLLCVGETTIKGLLEGEDVLRTAEACRALGGVVTRSAAGCWSIKGAGLGSVVPPRKPLDFGNAGTGSRLMMGVVAGHPIVARFDGDASLRKRPMRRVLDPLIKQGARVLEEQEGGRLPIVLQGSGAPFPVEYATPVASAQIKSAILLAGLNSPGRTVVMEREASRDHTEKMLVHFGARVTVEPHNGLGRKITLEGRPNLQAREVLVPADPSSAAFPLAAALIVPGSDVLIELVMINPLRCGLIESLLEMGADITIENWRSESGEEIADLRARHSPGLRGVEVPAMRTPSMIDEYPILAVVAAFASGNTTMRGLAELRVKESDRLAAIAAGLDANGVSCSIRGDDLCVQGAGGAVRGGGLVETDLDHRIAMSFLIMGLGSQEPVTVDDASMIATSFPDFRALMENSRGEVCVNGLVIAIDGPAASGKGTLARRLAERFSLPHLDTGLLYRATACALLDEGLPLNDVEAATAAARGLSLVDFDEERLRSREMGEAASVVAALPPVRAALIDLQRRFANCERGAVLDGRDIGTVICPNAQIKIFVTATPETRAQRRALELAARGEKADYNSILCDVKKRDERDGSRSVAPLKPAIDAIVLDTSELDIEEAFHAALAIVERAKR